MSPCVEVADLPIVANVMELSDVIKVSGQASILLGVDMVMKWRIRDVGKSNPYQCYTTQWQNLRPEIL